MSELSDPQWGCSFPGVPQFAYFTEQGENDVKISWTYPHDSAEQVGVSHYDVYRDDALGQSRVALKFVGVFKFVPIFHFFQHLCIAAI